MYLVQTVAPIKEPITLNEAKAFAVVFEDEDNALLESFISTAREYAENYTNRQFELATFELYTDRFTQNMVIPKGHIKSIEKIEYMDNDGIYQILDTNLYYLFGENDIFRVHFEKTMPHKHHKKAIKITFVAGYDSVPNSIKTYIKHIVSTMYENREKFYQGTNISEIIGDMYISILYKYRIQPL